MGAESALRLLVNAPKLGTVIIIQDGHSQNTGPGEGNQTPNGGKVA